MHAERQCSALRGGKVPKSLPNLSPFQSWTLTGTAELRFAGGCNCVVARCVTWPVSEVHRSTVDQRWCVSKLTGFIERRRGNVPSYNLAPSLREKRSTRTEDCPYLTAIPRLPSLEG